MCVTAAKGPRTAKIITLIIIPIRQSSIIDGKSVFVCRYARVAL